jgi:hypothetical protein
VNRRDARRGGGPAGKTRQRHSRRERQKKAASHDRRKNLEQRTANGLDHQRESISLFHANQRGAIITMILL